MKSDYTVVELRRWVHTDGRTASVYGSLPYWGENDGWSIELVGYTVYNPKYNVYGWGCKPFETPAEAQKFIDSLPA